MSKEHSARDAAVLAVDHINRAYLQPLLGGRKNREQDGGEEERAAAEVSQEVVSELCRAIRQRRLLANLSATSVAHERVRKRWLVSLTQLLRPSGKASAPSAPLLRNCFLAISLLRASAPQLDYESLRSHCMLWIETLLAFLKGNPSASSSATNAATNDRFESESAELRCLVRLLAARTISLLISLACRHPDLRRELTSGSPAPLTGVVTALLRCAKREDALVPHALAALRRCLHVDPSAMRPYLGKVETACFPLLDSEDASLRALAVSCLASIPSSQKPALSFASSSSSSSSSGSADSLLPNDGWSVLLRRTLGSILAVHDTVLPSDRRSQLIPSRDLIPHVQHLFDDLHPFAFAEPSPLPLPDLDHSPVIFAHASALWLRSASNRLDGLSSLLCALLSSSFPITAAIPLPVLLCTASLLIIASSSSSLSSPSSSSSSSSSSSASSKRRTNDPLATLQPVDQVAFTDKLQQCGHAMLCATLARCSRASLLPYLHFVCETLLTQLHAVRPSEPLPSCPAELERMLLVHRSVAALVDRAGAQVWDHLSSKLLLPLVKELAAVGSRRFEESPAQLPGSRLVGDPFFLESSFSAHADMLLAAGLLGTLLAIVSSSAALFTADLRSLVEKALILQAVIALKSLPSPPHLTNVYSHGPTRLLVLKALLAVVTAPATAQSPALPYALSVFRAALSDPFPPIAVFALHAQGACLAFTRPRSLPVSTSNPPFSQLLASSVPIPFVSGAPVASTAFSLPDSHSSSRTKRPLPIPKSSPSEAGEEEEEEEDHDNAMEENDADPSSTGLHQAEPDDHDSSPLPTEESYAVDDPVSDSSDQGPSLEVYEPSLVFTTPTHTGAALRAVQDRSLSALLAAQPSLADGSDDSDDDLFAEIHDVSPSSESE
ncbi:MAG: hypothetical protein Q8P67_05790 [archaeon]|nr:hypothetical protein [archaeon]